MMPDWEDLIRRELAGLVLRPDERREVVAELAEHLEETCQAMLRLGVSRDEAVRRTLLRVGNWRHLRKKIQAARSEDNSMTNRIKQFWLPGLLTLSVSMLLLMLIQFVGPKPLIVGRRGSHTIPPVAVFYVPWLLSLVPVGAIGAYLAGRAGASSRTVFLSIVFPVLPYLALFVVVFPVSLILDDHVAHNILLSALWMGLSTFVLVPGTALLAGGLPLLHLRSRRLRFQRVSSHG